MEPLSRGSGVDCRVGVFSDVVMLSVFFCEVLDKICIRDAQVLYSEDFFSLCKNAYIYKYINFFHILSTYFGYVQFVY